jgi:hypothetical protein
MTPEEEKTLRQAAETIADILYNNTPKEQVQDFEGIELALRDHWLQTLGPELAQKFCQQRRNDERAQARGAELYRSPNADEQTGQGAEGQSA